MIRQCPGVPPASTQADLWIHGLGPDFFDRSSNTLIIYVIAINPDPSMEMQDSPGAEACVPDLSQLNNLEN